MKMTSMPLSKMVAALVVVSAASHTFAADTVKIGIAGPITGPVAQYGEMVSSGAKMAIEQINSSGGVLGKSIEAVLYDDACDPKQAVAVANRVVNDGVKFVIGHVCSSSTQPASDVYEDENIVMISAASTAPGITSRGYQMVFRTIGTDSMQAPVAVSFIADKLKPKTVAVVHDKQQYGEGIATAVMKGLQAKGMKVSLFEGINAGDRDYSSLIAKLKQADVDFVYYGGYHPELGLILRQASEKGLKARFMGPEGVGNSEISAIAGSASKNLLVTLPKLFDEDPENKTLAESFKARNQDPSGAYVLPGYSAVQVISQAITKTGSTDPKVVAAAMHAGMFNTPIGNIGFDSKGDLTNFEFVIYQWHSDGTKTAVR